MTLAFLEADAPLRDAILSGQHSRPEIAQLAPRLERFLRDDQAALGIWFGCRGLAATGNDPDRLRGLIDRDLALIDDLIAEQLDTILHDQQLQKFEGSWRGLSGLVREVDPRGRVKIKIISAAWRELDRDIARSIEFDQSNLFRMIYENEFGIAGGEPFGLLLIDHEVSHRPAPRGPSDLAPVDDISLMTSVASIAAAAFVPTVLAASPSLLGVDRFEDLALVANVTSVLRDDDHARWRAATSREDMRFLCVTLPRVLARPRWTTYPDHEGGLRYEEYAPSGRERSWSVAGYAFALTVARSHADHGWPADIRGVATDSIGGGLVSDLPRELFTFGAITSCPRSPLSLALTDTQERSLALAGFMPLNSLPYGEAVFASVRSLQAIRAPTPGRDPTPAQANQRISTQISAMLCASRFAHYIKIIGREATGSFSNPSDIQSRLTSWLMNYVNTNPSSSAELRARAPLLSANVAVEEIEGRPGFYGCVIQLQPHHQLDDTSTTFRLITNLTNASVERS